jgi:DNA-binding CsgD family transcriptional regulator
MKKQIPHKDVTLSAIRVTLLGDRSGTGLSGLLNQTKDSTFDSDYQTIEKAVREIRTLLEADESIKTVLLIKSLPPLKSEYDLTPHERRILKLFVEGRSFQVTAQVLGVSINTVSFHVRRIYEKLEVHSKSEAVAKAIRNNLV